jgi:exodeoxyribonuclease VII small subunit
VADAASHRARPGRAAGARATAARSATKSAKSAGKRGRSAAVEPTAGDPTSEDGLLRTDTGEPVPFEAAMSRLVGVVDALERGELELEQALTTFEEGVRLTRHCAQQLDAAERRIEILTAEGDAWVARSFGDQDGADGEPDDSDEPLED